MNKEFKNYFRAFRLKSGLTQRDVADLLGLRSHDQVSNLERRKCLPSLRVILTCRLLYGAEVSLLLPAYTRYIEQDVQNRAVALQKRLDDIRKTPQRERRRNAIKRLTALR